MTAQEFSNMFDTLLNSYNTQAVFGEESSRADIVLNEYEKSVLLTLALDIIVKSYFDRTLNNLGLGFDDSTRRQIDFGALIKVWIAPEDSKLNSGNYDERGTIYKLPDDVLFMLNEKIKISNKLYTVVPISYTEYDRQMAKAYTLPLKKQAWRLFEGSEANSPKILRAEIIPSLIGSSKPTIESYTIRYIRRPKPIVLEDLTADGLTIDGVSTPSDNMIACELNPIIHIDILNKAVELALSTRGRMLPTLNNSNRE